MLAPELQRVVGLDVMSSSKILADVGLLLVVEETRGSGVTGDHGLQRREGGIHKRTGNTLATTYLLLS